jgi:hypothetical protein
MAVFILSTLTHWAAGFQTHFSRYLLYVPTAFLFAPWGASRERTSWSPRCCRPWLVRAYAL